MTERTDRAPEFRASPIAFCASSITSRASEIHEPELSSHLFTLWVERGSVGRRNQIGGPDLAELGLSNTASASRKRLSFSFCRPCCANLFTRNQYLHAGTPESQQRRDGIVQAAYHCAFVQLASWCGSAAVSSKLITWHAHHSPHSPNSTRGTQLTLTACHQFAGTSATECQILDFRV